MGDAPTLVGVQANSALFQFAVFYDFHFDVGCYNSIRCILHVDFCALTSFNVHKEHLEQLVLKGQRGGITPAAGAQFVGGRRGHVPPTSSGGGDIP